MTVARMVAGRYRLDNEIGRGSMGTVWNAYDVVLRRRVAIKEVNFPAGMPAAEVEQLADRTLREARAIAALSHPHVITLFDIVTASSGPVIVMELMEALSLAQTLADTGPLSPAQAAVIGRSVASGLAAAHRAGITHRDVKPANVLIAPDGRIKLTDFGIARAAGEQTLTATGMLLGSPAYISPEVASGRPATPSADAWGLGALLFATVEGHPPFDRGKPIDTLTAVVSDPVPPHPRSGPLARVINGLLVKDPGRRMTVSWAEGMLDDIAGDTVYPEPGTGNAPDLGAGRPPLTSPRNGAPPAAQLSPSRQSSPAAQLSPGLPPPPWAATGADSLPPLPVSTSPSDARGRPSRSLRWLVGVAAAAVGFLLVISLALWV